MTTIVATPTVIVADSRCSHACTGFATQKVFRTPSGELIGIAGSLGDALKFVEWYSAGANLKKKPEFLCEEGFDALVVDGSRIVIWDHELIPTPIFDPFYAIGSGSHAALGALHSGQDPVEAVKIACLVDRQGSSEPIVKEEWRPVRSTKQPKRKSVHQKRKP